MRKTNRKWEEKAHQKLNMLLNSHTHTYTRLFWSFINILWYHDIFALYTKPNQINVILGIDSVWLKRNALKWNEDENPWVLICVRSFFFLSLYRLCECGGVDFFLIKCILLTNFSMAFFPSYFSLLRVHYA